MAIGGWYYVSASNFQGPTGSVQFKKGATYISGSNNFTYLSSSSTLNLTGTLNVEGVINYGAMANNQTMISTNTTIAANSRAVLYLDDDEKMTIANGGKLEIREGAKAILKSFPLS